MTYDENNIFAKILRKEIPCDKVYEDEFSLFFNDIHPQAKIHVLGIPKFPCSNFSEFLKNADNKNISFFFNSIQLVINKLNIEESGYRLITILDRILFFLNNNVINNFTNTFYIFKCK